eukprot:13516529-Alexandrium_andersonii.AAC.1
MGKGNSASVVVEKGKKGKGKGANYQGFGKGLTPIQWATLNWSLDITAMESSGIRLEPAGRNPIPGRW